MSQPLFGTLKFFVEPKGSDFLFQVKFYKKYLVVHFVIFNLWVATFSAISA